MKSKVSNRRLCFLPLILNVKLQPLVSLVL